MSKRILAGAVLAGAVVTALGGCGIVKTTPRLPADAFVANQAVIGQEAGQGTDRSGQLVVGAHHRPVQPVTEDPQVSDTVRDVVKPPGADVRAVEPAPAATQGVAVAAAPATTRGAVPPGVPEGQARWIGSVIVRVDGTPIFADKVLAVLDHALAIEAKSGNEAHFRALAQDAINKQIQEFIYNELEFAAAKRAMEKKDEEYATRATIEWRKEQVRQHGGSESEWRKKVAEDGLDFDEVVKQQFRINLTQIYYQTKIFPLIQISAQDMRQYYQTNAAKFQTQAAVKFRAVLWISSDAAGSRDAALKKANEAYGGAKDGEDFSDLVAKFNDDKALKETKGIIGGEKRWKERGEFAVQKVEDAVWALQVNKVSAPIEAENQRRKGFWIAKLDEIRSGTDESFENPRLQEAIRSALRREQFIKLREAQQQKLQRDAATEFTPGYNQVMMQMVMQRYQVWVASR